MKLKFLVTFACAAVTGAASAQTSTANFPDHALRVTIGYGPGVLDASARLIASSMSKRFGQPIVVEPIIGASGLFAGQAVMRARPDGYTMLYGVSVGFSPIFMRDSPIKADTQLAPISNLAVTPYVVMVGGKLPIRSVADLVAYGKANPGKLDFGAPPGTTALLSALFKARTGSDYVFVQYKGSNEVLAAMLSGEIGVTIGAPGGWGPQYKSGAIRGLMVTTHQRIPLLPDVPTAAELGIGFPQGNNFGLWGTVGTPRDVIQKLNEAAVAAVHSPDVASVLKGDEVALELVGSTPEEQLNAYHEEIKFLTEAARLANYKPQ